MTTRPIVTRLLTGALLTAAAWSQADTPQVVFRAQPPAGLPDIPAPASNPLSEETFNLGRTLFFDPTLSDDRTIACASCHLPGQGFASPEPRPRGVHGRRALRHAPTLLNRGYGKSQRWDGLAATLEEQVLLPIADPNEMGLAVDDAVLRLKENGSYRQAFRAVFGRDPDREGLAFALAGFVRGLTIGDSPADRFIQGEVTGLSKAERAGMWIYESKGGCWQCHPRPLFTDEEFHNTGVGAVDGVPQPGREAVTDKLEDRGRFKTPTLRGLTATAPYMHDGSLKTLRDVVEFYRRGGNDNVNRSAKLAVLELNDTEVAQLVAFLQVLSR